MLKYATKIEGNTENHKFYKGFMDVGSRRPLPLDTQILELPTACQMFVPSRENKSSNKLLCAERYFTSPFLSSKTTMPLRVFVKSSEAWASFCYSPSPSSPVPTTCQILYSTCKNLFCYCFLQTGKYQRDCSKRVKSYLGGPAGYLHVLYASFWKVDVGLNEIQHVWSPL